MTIAPEERQFVTKSFFAVALGVAALGAATFAIFLHYASTGRLFAYRPVANSGDTPVILVGGSMIFKSGSKNSPAWVPVTGGQDYYLTPNYDISEIVVKMIASDDGGDGHDAGDANTHTDKLRVDISAASTWEVDAYAQSDDQHAVVSITPRENSSGQTEIHLVRLDTSQGATLCPNGSLKRIKYGHTADCSDRVVFSKIELKVDSQSRGTITCIDDAAKLLGRCRIVFRGPPNS